ncbi:hypothetical protein OSTOST_02522 [Ostertagia ostertagi]
MENFTHAKAPSTMSSYGRFVVADTADTTMPPDILPLPYQVLYILLPTVSVVGNGSIVYVTIRSNIDGHRVKTNICINLQLAPIFASCFSLVLLLNVAIDRLLSLFSAYEALVARHRKYYLAVHILPVTFFVYYAISTMYGSVGK